MQLAGALFERRQKHLQFAHAAGSPIRRVGHHQKFDTGFETALHDRTPEASCRFRQNVQQKRNVEDRIRFPARRHY